MPSVFVVNSKPNIITTPRAPLRKTEAYPPPRAPPSSGSAATYLASGSAANLILLTYLGLLFYRLHAPLRDASINSSRYGSHYNININYR